MSGSSWLICPTKYFHNPHIQQGREGKGNFSKLKRGGLIILASSEIRAAVKGTRLIFQLMEVDLFQGDLFLDRAGM